MKETKLIKRKAEQGITLIALVVTIVVLLILAGVTITFVLSDGGILQKAREAANKTNNAIANEQGDMDKLPGAIENFVGVGSSTTEGPISKTDSFVGYYVKIDGEYGIIYADLAVGNTKSGKWGEATYSIPKEENPETLKEYYIVEESYTAKGFAPRPVLAAKNPEDDSKKDRFYVMALEDLSSETCSGSIGMYAFDLSGGFGGGYNNTRSIIAQAQSKEEQDNVWKALAEKFNEGWFIPSRMELIASAGELEIDPDNYQGRNLKNFYYSSTGSNTIQTMGSTYTICFEDTSMNLGGESEVCYLRLHTTF